MGTLWESWQGGSLDHVALGGGIGDWLYSTAGYTRDRWTGLVTLRVPEPSLTGAARVSRHVNGEGTTGWSWARLAPLLTTRHHRHQHTHSS